MDQDLDSGGGGVSARKKKMMAKARSSPQMLHKLKLSAQDSTASNGSIFCPGKDSGIADENHSGISVGVIPEGLQQIFQGDFASGGSGMLISEPQSEVEVAEHQILGRILSHSKLADENGEASSGSKKFIALINPFDKKMKDLRTLKQHYYPEGGWGWVIVLVTLAVQIISHGLQFSLAMFVMSVPKSSVISRRLLNDQVDQQTGKLFNFSKISIYRISFVFDPL